MGRSQAGLALGVLAAACWSPHFRSVVAALGEGTPVFVLHFYIVLWAALACLIPLLLAGRFGDLAVFKRHETHMILLALAGGYGFWLLRALALERSGADPSHVHILFYLAPLMLGVFSIPTREGASGRQVGALVLGFVGCILIASRPPDAQAQGGGPGFGTALLAVGAGACWALFALLARPLVQEERVLPTSAALWGIGALCLLATCLATGENVIAISRKALWASMWLGAATVALGVGLWLKCLAQSAPAAAAPLWYMALVFGLLFAPGRPGWWSVGGAALIVVAIYLGRAGRPRAQMSMADLIRG